jgi:N-acetylglucosamine kinase-like BadF-type ATPase
MSSDRIDHRGRDRLPAVLAIDAGNSKTDVAIVGHDGRVLGSARGLGFHPHRLGADAAVEGLVPLVAKAAVEVGHPLPPGSVVVEHVSACLANADLPSEQQLLSEAIDRHGWGRSSFVGNDTLALLRAGTDERRAVAVICGAGSNCVAVLPDGRSAGFAAVGHISGDWGGGYHLWQEAMWWAARAEDGRGPDTALRTALPKHLQLDSMRALIEAVHLGDVTTEQCAELTPLLFAVAAAGDSVASDVVHRQAEEIVALVVSALRRLDLVDGDQEPIDVLLGGGVLTARHPQLNDTVEALLHDAAPHARPRLVTAPLILGAALLGLDHVDASPDAVATLRSTYAGRA